MGDRVSISFKEEKNDNEEESIILFNHWGGVNFPKVAFDWFKDYKKKIDKTAKGDVSAPIARFDCNNLMVQFVQWLGQEGHYRECIGFEKDENDKSIYDKPLYSDYTIFTKKCELIDDRGQSIK